MIINLLFEIAGTVMLRLFYCSAFLNYSVDGDVNA